MTDSTVTVNKESYDKLLNAHREFIGALEAALAYMEHRPIFASDAYRRVKDTLNKHRTESAYDPN